MEELTPKEEKKMLGVLNYLVGQVIKETHGCADPILTKQIICRLLIKELMKE